MPDLKITDDELLKKIELTGDELSTMQSRFHEFVMSLNEAEVHSLSVSLPSAAQAAATLGPDVTPERLEAFIRAYAPKNASLVIHNFGAK